MSRKLKTRKIDFAARMQAALSAGLARAERRRSQARQRILLAGFWVQATPRPSAHVVQLYPAVNARRAPTSNA